jgi:replicative DNA helicase
VITVAIEDKVLALLAKDTNFGAQVMAYLYEDLFTLPQHKEFFKLIKHFYGTYGTPPTLELVVHEAKKNADALQPEIFRALGQFIYDVYNNTDMTYEVYVKKEIREFVRVAAMRSLIAKAGMSLSQSTDLREQNENIAGIIREFDKMRMVGDVTAKVPTELVSTVHQRIIDREVAEKFQRVPTGMRFLDMDLAGGLGLGELGIIYAPYNVGKSFLLQQFCVNAAKAGKRALMISLELVSLDVLSRMESNITGIPSDELVARANELKIAVQTLMEPYKDKILVLDYPTGTLSVDSINAVIKQVESLHGKVDVVFIDGADNLFIKDYGAMRFELKRIYERLRAISQENKVGVWTVSQVNRQGLEADTVRGKHSAEDISKMFTADVVLSLNQKESEYPGTVRIWIEKNRRRKKWIERVCRADFSIGRIEMLETPNGVFDPVTMNNLQNMISQIKVNPTPNGNGHTLPLGVPKTETTNS